MASTATMLSVPAALSPSGHSTSCWWLGRGTTRPRLSLLSDCRNCSCSGGLSTAGCITRAWICGDAIQHNTTQYSTTRKQATNSSRRRVQRNCSECTGRPVSTHPLPPFHCNRLHRRLRRPYDNHTNTQTPRLVLSPVRQAVWSFAVASRARPTRWAARQPATQAGCACRQQTALQCLPAPPTAATELRQHLHSSEALLSALHSQRQHQHQAAAAEGRAAP